MEREETGYFGQAGRERQELIDLEIQEEISHLGRTP